ncbi:DUF3048 domain-containing protein [Candidatus Saccharibacteria bacterium]|nr:DUF3048 domain-containing protein [Candidatus Saccharibacteria bacterium]
MKNKTPKIKHQRKANLEQIIEKSESGEAPKIEQAPVVNQEENVIDISDKELSKADKKAIKKANKKSHFKLIYVILAVVVVLMITADFLAFFLWYKPTKLDQQSSDFAGFSLEEKDEEHFYSVLDGTEIADESLNSSPVFCIQVPNGTDGARPQAGLNEAKIIFEAVAEAGITRFAAIFQNSTTSAIGPVRSLRIYYLEWDTPFDCTIVHAGGPGDAIAAVNAGGYKDLTESYVYMWRSNTNSVLYRAWNNLFTSSSRLTNFANANGYTTSSPVGFARLTPTEAASERVKKQVANQLDIDTATEESVSTFNPEVTSINIRYGYVPNFNPHYDYDANSNTYKRSYESGAEQLIYNCPEGNGEVTPETTCGEPTVASPNVVIAMMVNEGKASDNYHEAITTTGSGKAYIFQNGTAIEGTWEKPSVGAQIVFKDSSDTEIKLVPGQTWISAVPNYGAVEYN